MLKTEYAREYYIKNKQQCDNNRKRYYKKHQNEEKFRTMNLQRTKRYQLRKPYIMHYLNAKRRCNKNGVYFKKINFNLTINDIKQIWLRDEAYKLKNPSLDRINTYGDYILDNCRFIELKENQRRKKRKKCQI